MPTRLELLLEAERRGILPPDAQSSLDEARTRGLLGDEPQPTTAPVTPPAIPTPRAAGRVPAPGPASRSNPDEPRAS